MNGNVKQIEQTFNKERTSAYRGTLNICRKWMLALARISRSRWILPSSIKKKSASGPQSGVVCSERHDWQRMANRPSLQSPLLCESKTFKKSYPIRKYFRKQQKHPSPKCEKNSLQAWSCFRPTLSYQKRIKQISEILFYLPSRKNKTTSFEMGENSFIGWSLNKIIFV